MPEDTSAPAQTDLPGRIYEAVLAALAEGRHAPDDAFTETELAAQFGVSRTPVREALSMLARDGLLAPSGRSFRVPRYSRADMQALFSVRARLEPYAVRCAVERAGSEAIDAFVEMASAELARSPGAAAYMRCHRRIRSALFALSGNRRIVEAIETFEHQTAFVRQKTLRDEANRRHSIALWGRLIDSVAARDAAAAEAAMGVILDAAFEAMVRVIEGRGAGPG